MISSIFNLTRIRRKKLNDMIHFFFNKEMKFYIMNKKGLIRFGSNIFTFIFKPSFIHVSEFILSYLSPKVHNLNRPQGYIPIMDSTTYVMTALTILRNYDIVDRLHNVFILRKYNLSIVQEFQPSLRAALRNKALKEAVYIDNFSNVLLRYIKKKFNTRQLDVFELFEYAKSKLSVAAKHFEIRTKDAIMRDLSVFRAPPGIQVYRQVLNTA